MDNESDVRLKIRKCVEEFYINLQNPSTLIYLLVGGILEKHTGSLSTMKVGYILKKLKFSDSEIRRAKSFLTDKGWIIPGKKRWLELSKPSWSIFERLKQRMKEEGWEEIVNFILKEADELKFDTPSGRPLGKIRSLVRKIGEDLVIYADKGERQRVKYGLKAIKKLVGSYRKVYILHAPKNDEFIKEVKKEMEEFSTLPIEPIESEIWRKENFKKIFEIVNYPRKQLDILITAMPRACIIQLYRALNYPHSVCLQNWYYNKAKRYVYNKTGYVTEVEILERGSKKEKMICFGENVFTRFEHEMFYDLVDESFLTFMGRADYDVHSRSYDVMELEVDQRTQRMVNLCLRGNIQLVGKIEPFDVDYNSVWSVFQVLNYHHPDTVWVSGNRVTALGIAMYWVECSISGRRVNIYAPHVEAESYSEDIIPELKLIHSVQFDDFSMSVRKVA